MTLTREEKCERIAAACDWDFDPTEAHGWKSRGRWVKHPKLTDGKLVFRHSIPDYFGSLDACHEMEKAISTSEQRADFSRHLIQILNDALRNTPRFIGPSSFDQTHAAAEHRAEAFGRTLNLWNE